MTAAPALGWRHPWRVGSALIWNDVKQGLRKHLRTAGWRGRLLQLVGAIFGLGFLAVLHLMAYGLVRYLGDTPALGRANLFTGVSTAVWSFLFFVMISGGLMRALVVLHEQDDSSLLLASPVSPRAILAGRLFGNALQSCLVDGFIIVPWINVRAFAFGDWAALWGYPVWLALAIIVTCVDGLFSFGLIRWLGLRRARLFSQAVPFALIFGVTFCASSMGLSVAAMTSSNGANLPPGLKRQFVELVHTPLALMARAAEGDFGPLAAIFLTAILLAYVTLRGTERAFVAGTQNLAADAGRGASKRADRPFRSNLFLLEITKNLRLVARTPMILVQCFAQIFTPVGVAVLIGRDDAARAVAFFIIFASGVLAGMLTIAAGTVEEADDLLGMSPRRSIRFRWGKIATGILCLVVPTCGAALGLLLFGHPREAVAVFFGGLPLGLVASLVGETFARPVPPGQKPRLLADPVMMIPLLGLQISSGLVAGVTVFAAAFSFPALVASLAGSYLILGTLLALAQLRKPLWQEN